MKKLKMFILVMLGGLFFSSANEPLQANAVTFTNSPTSGVWLDFNHEPGNEDFAHIRRFWQSPNTLPHLVENPWGFLLGFDEASGLVEEITGIGFRVVLRETNVAQDIGNTIRNWFGFGNKHGELKEVELWVSSETTGYFHNGEEFTFPYIGLMEDLKTIEEAYYASYPIAGSPIRNEKKQDFKLSTSNRSIAKRKFYVIIPFNDLVEGQYETFDYYKIDGTFISSGTDNGKPFKTEDGEMYIDIQGGTDFAVAINGINAKLKRIEVLEYPSDPLKLLIENGSWNYASQKVEFIKNRVQLINDSTKELNWNIGNDNRYIFVKYSGSLEALQEAKIRVFYDNDNDSASWIVRALDRDGKLLPPGINVEPPGRQELDLFGQLRMVISVIFAILVVYLFIKLLVLFFQLIGSGRKAFGRRR